MINKKAQTGNALMIFWFLFLLILIGAGLVIGIGLFFGEPYDFRQIDANALNTQLTDCLKTKTIDLRGTNEDIGSEIYKECKIHKETSNHGLFILIKNQSQDQIFKVGKGDDTQCALASLNENFPRCKNSTIILGSNKFHIFAGSNQIKEDRLT